MPWEVIRQTFVEELPQVKGAWRSVLVLLAVAFGGGWLSADLFYSEKIASADKARDVAKETTENVKSLMELRTEQSAQIRKELQKVSNDAQSQVISLKNKLTAITASAWTIGNETKRKLFESMTKEDTKIGVSILSQVGNIGSQDFGRELTDVFLNSGWQADFSINYFVPRDLVGLRIFVARNKDGSPEITERSKQLSRVLTAAGIDHSTEPFPAYNTSEGVVYIAVGRKLEK